jgi:hypothetical protein
MITTGGERFYGKVESMGDACVRTRFAHFQLLPLAPMSSWLLVVGSRERVLRLPLVRRSVVAGYTRMWGPVAAFIGLALTDGISHLFGVPLLVGGLAATLWGWAWAGRLTSSAKKQREIYAHFAGAPVDVALIAGARRGPDTKDAEAWLGEVTRAAEKTIEAEGADLAASYRGRGRHTDWQSVAERAATATSSARHAALTLARIATATDDDAQRAEASAAHERIWSVIAALG